MEGVYGVGNSPRFSSHRPCPVAGPIGARPFQVSIPICRRPSRPPPSLRCRANAGPIGARLVRLSAIQKLYRERWMRQPEQAPKLQAAWDRAQLTYDDQSQEGHRPSCATCSHSRPSRTDSPFWAVSGRLAAMASASTWMTRTSREVFARSRSVCWRFDGEMVFGSDEVRPPRCLAPSSSRTRRSCSQRSPEGRAPPPARSTNRCEAVVGSDGKFPAEREEGEEGGQPTMMTMMRRSVQSW